MKIKELVKLKKLLLEYGQELRFGDIEVSPLALIIASVEKQLDMKHEFIIENRWGYIPNEQSGLIDMNKAMAKLKVNGEGL